MTQFTRRVAAAGAAALALTISMGASTATASHEAPEAPPGYAPSWLALNTTQFAGNTVEKWTAGPEGVATASRAPEFLTAGTSCALLPPTGSDYLRFAAAGTGSQGVGLSAGAIGVRERKNSSGESCSLVDAVRDEELTLSLGSDVGGLVAASASLDINLKGDTVIEATASGPLGPLTFHLVSGAPTDPAYPDAFYCELPSSSGPDNGTSNNCRWDISAPSWTHQAEDGFVFSTLTLRAVTGSFSLMGGADGAATTPTPLPPYFEATGPSVFELVDGTVKCGDTVSAGPTTKVSKSTWKRLGNLTPTGTTLVTDPGCRPYPYTATTGTATDTDTNTVKPLAEFKKPLTYQANSQAIWQNTFLYEGSSSTVPPVFLDLDGDTAGFLTPPACNPSWYDKRGNFVGPPSSIGLPDPYGCLVSAVKGKNVGTSRSAIYTAYIFGDAGMRN